MSSTAIRHGATADRARRRPAALLLVAGLFLLSLAPIARAGDQQGNLLNARPGKGPSGALQVVFGDPGATLELALQAVYSTGTTVTLETSVPPSGQWEAASQTWGASKKVLTALAIGPLLYRVNVTANAPTVVHAVGTGLSDFTASDTYSAAAAAVFTVTIDATGTPDTFKWKKDSGAFTLAVPITGAAQTLSDGQTITFAATTGHTLADSWTVTENTVTVSVCVSGRAELDFLP